MRAASSFTNTGRSASASVPLELSSSMLRRCDQPGSHQSPVAPPLPATFADPAWLAPPVSDPAVAGIAPLPAVVPSPPVLALPPVAAPGALGAGAGSLPHAR